MDKANSVKKKTRTKSTIAVTIFCVVIYMQRYFFDSKLLWKYRINNSFQTYKASVHCIVHQHLHTTHTT